jgi:2'-5' RNA ligase
MSIRFGVLLIPSPSFTARAYRARQLICGQYGSWAAEMHMLHLTVAGFFQCSEAALAEVEAGLQIAAEESRQREPRFSLHQQGVTGASGNIFLDLSGPQRPEALHKLHGDVVDIVRRVSGAVLEMEHVEGGYWPHVTMMQYAKLPSAVMADALEFAQGVVDDLAVPESTNAWRLLLVRFQSQAAEEDWSEGRWAPDLSWDIISSYPL